MPAWASWSRRADGQPARGLQAPAGAGDRRLRLVPHRRAAPHLPDRARRAARARRLAGALPAPGPAISTRRSVTSTTRRTSHDRRVRSRPLFDVASERGDGTWTLVLARDLRHAPAPRVKLHRARAWRPSPVHRRPDLSSPGEATLTHIDGEVRSRCPPRWSGPRRPACSSTHVGLRPAALGAGAHRRRHPPGPAPPDHRPGHDPQGGGRLAPVPAGGREPARRPARRSDPGDGRHELRLGFSTRPTPSV